MEKFDTSEGKWRTVGGRRIFIRDGESLSEAMKKSGKFKSQKGKKLEEDAKNTMSSSEINTRVRNNADLAEKIINDDEWNDVSVSYYGGSDAQITNERTGQKIKITPSDTKESLAKKIEDSYNSKELKENYNRNLAEKQKMEKMGTTEYLMEKQRERGSFKDEKSNELQRKADEVVKKMSDKDLKEKYMNISEEERVKAYEEGKNWKDLVKENEEKTTKSGERDKRTITKKEMEEDFNRKVKQDSELSRQTEQARTELKARDEKARVLYQKGEIEKASGLEVKNAWETDLYGNGREHRFELSDGRIVAHTLESFGQEDDTWSIGKGSDRKSYKSYSDMMKDLGSSKSSSNTPYKKAFEEYKKKHPNSKLTLNKFIDMSEGK